VVLVYQQVYQVLAIHSKMYLLENVSIGNKLKNFGKGVGSALRGNKQVKVQVRTGPFGLGRATQLRSVSSTPMTLAGLSGEFTVNVLRRHGRTGQKSIISNSSKPSFVERMKQKFKPTKTTKTTKTTNIGNIEMSNMSQPKQQAGNKKKPSKKEKKLSKKETTPSKKETTPSKKEKKPSKKEKNPSENKKNPSENKKKSSKK
jgi:hypothetical protein